MNHVTRMGEIAFPFRILPSRGQDRVSPKIIVPVGIAIAIAGLVFGDDAAGKFGFAVAGCVVAGAGVHLFRRERRYFHPKANYWIAVSASALTIVAPDGEVAHAWDDLGSFVVTREVRESHNGKSASLATTITYTLSATTPDGRLNVDLGDFATRFAGGDQDRAEAMCAALNELRQLCRSGNTAGPYAVPDGLIVAPLPEAVAATSSDGRPANEKSRRPKPARPISSVVER